MTDPDLICIVADLQWTQADMARLIGKDEAQRLVVGGDLALLTRCVLTELAAVIDKRRKLRHHSLADLGELLQDRISKQGPTVAVVVIRNLYKSM